YQELIMLVSLIINTYNRMHTLPNALDAVQRLRYPHLEVIVVNGPSTDNTEEYLQKNWAGKLKILSCPEANLSLSRNIGIAAAAGDIIAFTDDDGIPEPDWLDWIVQAYDDPSVGAVGGFVRNNSGVEFQTKFILSNRNGDSNEFIDSKEFWKSNGKSKFEFKRLIGVNCSFRKSVLLEVGGFDEEYSYFYDEVDLAIRINEAGFEFDIIPTAEVHHKYAASHIRTEKGVPRTWLAIARSTAYFCIKNALPEQSLLDTFKLIEDHRNKFLQHTNWARVHGNLSEHDTNALLQSLNDGITQGVKDAFAYPLRRLLQSDDIRPELFLQFPRILENKKRKKISFRHRFISATSLWWCGCIHASVSRAVG
ncbi:Glycosyl transferase, family 2 domain protein, partial [mine drainage metagenome]